LNELENLYEEKSDHIVAIGECGIDLHFPDNPPLEVQQYALKLQAELARKLNLH
jgi:Tat protein secretion system quality control protein TatD with DNase activity